MEWGGEGMARMFLSEGLCSQVIRHLPPASLARLSCVSVAARRLTSTSDVDVHVWQPICDAAGVLYPALHSIPSPGHCKEAYRKWWAKRCKDALWAGRKRKVRLEDAARSLAEELLAAQASLARLRGAVAEQAECKRRRIVHQGWHPSAVRMGLATPRDVHLICTADPAGAGTQAGLANRVNPEVALFLLQTHEEVARTLVPRVKRARDRFARAVDGVGLAQARWWRAMQQSEQGR